MLARVLKILETIKAREDVELFGSTQRKPVC